MELPIHGSIARELATGLNSHGQLFFHPQTIHNTNNIQVRDTHIIITIFLHH